MATLANKVTVFPIRRAMPLSSPAPTARLIITVLPIARPTIITVTMCISWLPMAIAEITSAPLN